GRIRRSPSSGARATTPMSSRSATSRCSRSGGFLTTPKAGFGPSAWLSCCTRTSTGRGCRTARLGANAALATRSGTQRRRARWPSAGMVRAPRPFGRSSLRRSTLPTRGASLLPSGDAYLLLDGAERTLLVPREDQRQRLWTPRVWPGALLVEGEIRGTWRRAHHTVRIDAWARLSRGARDAIEAEATGLPLPGLERPIDVVWTTSKG